MGVFTLMTYIKEHRDKVATEVYLDRYATKRRVGRDKALLLCDYGGVVRVLEDAILKRRQPKFCGYYGCDTRLLARQFELFIESLRSIDIEPIFFADGPTLREDFKFEEKKERQVKKWKRSKEWEEAVKGGHHDKSQINLSHPLCYPVCDFVLKKLKVECLISNCEADVILIDWYKGNRNALGILSQDTDLAIADGCRFLPLEFFDSEDAIGFHKGDIKLGGAKSLKCRYTDRGALSRALGLPYDDMTWFAMLCSNDYTRPYINAKRETLRIPKGAKSVAQWIREGNAQRAKVEIMQMEGFREVYEYSKDLYSGKLQFIKPIDFSTEMLSPVFLSIKNGGTIWQQPVAEAPSLRLPQPYTVSQPIRSTVYALYPCEKVKEYGYHPFRSEGSIRGIECIQVEGHKNLCETRAGLQGCRFIVKAVALHHFVNTPLYKLGFKGRTDKLWESVPRDLPRDIDDQEVLRGVIAVSTVAYLASDKEMKLDENEARACLLAFAATTAGVPGDVDIGKPDPPDPFLRAVALSSTITTILLSLCYIAELLDLAPKVSDIFCSSVFVPTYMAVMKHLPAGTPATLKLAHVVDAIDSSHAVELIECIGTMRSTHGEPEMTLRDTLATAIRSYTSLVRALAQQQQR